MNPQLFREDHKPKFSSDTIHKLISDLRSDDGIIREDARHQLVKLGEDVVDYLGGYLNADDVLLRWEVVKTLADIQKPVAAYFLVNAMEDNMISIRWIAAEGIIRLRQKGLKPLLERLIDSVDSPRIIEGAHHVFHSLKQHSKNPLYKEIFLALDNREAHEKIPIIADNIIHQLK
jgi:hypothetical protein